MLTLKYPKQYLINPTHAKKFIKAAVYWLKSGDGKKLHAQSGRALVFNDEIPAQQRMRNLWEKGV